MTPEREAEAREVAAHGTWDPMTGEYHATRDLPAARCAMTDLYEALRAAMTPDGRVRMTRELLTAMHEEGERRSRMDDDEIVRVLSFGMCSPKRHAEVGCDTCDAKNAAIASVRALRERAETAERELEGAEREADAQRERRKRAEIERDAAHERARVAERALAKVRDADVVDRSFYNLDRAAWSERAKRAESQLALAMTWGAELADAARCEAKRAENASAERFATSLVGTIIDVDVRPRKRVRIIAREPLDPAPQSPQTEIILTSGPAGILFHVADAGSVGVLEDFLRYLGHEIVVDKPATLASPIANTGLDELVREAGEKGDT